MPIPSLVLIVQVGEMPGLPKAVLLEAERSSGMLVWNEAVFTIKKGAH